MTVSDDDYDHVKDTLERAKQGDAIYMEVAAGGYKHGNSGFPKNQDEAEKWLRLAAEAYRADAEKGDASAQRSLGRMYWEGESVPQDCITAVKWMRASAEQGNAGAQSFLGDWYHDGGKDFPPNFAEAVKWFRRAAKADSTHGQFLAKMYLEGKGVPRDPSKAEKWYRRSAKQPYNQKTACDLASIYRKGEGLPQSHKKAAKMYSLALKGTIKAAVDSDGYGEEFSFFHVHNGWAGTAFDPLLGLGEMYEKGEGVSESFRDAYVCYALAALIPPAKYLECNISTSDIDRATSTRDKVANEVADLSGLRQKVAAVVKDLEQCSEPDNLPESVRNSPMFPKKSQFQ